jgi:hypothetical protein
VSVACSPLSGSAFPLGESTVTVSATDLRGNGASRTFKVIVRDTTVPRLTHQTPRPGSFLRALTSLTGAAADVPDASGLSHVVIRLRRHPASGDALAGKYWKPGTGWVDEVSDLAVSGSGDWSVTDTLPTGTDLPDGRYLVVGYPFDNAGNTRYYGSAITIDGTAPAGAFTTPTDGASVTSLSSIRGSAADAGSGIARVLVRLRQVNNPRNAADDKWWTPGSGWGDAATVLKTDNAASWRVTDACPQPEDVTPGRYYLYLYVTDRAGNRTDIRISITRP